MTGEPIPLARPLIGEREEELVVQTLRSGEIGIGPRVAEFEQRLGAFLGAEHVSAISSGTAALHLAVRACGIEPGDEVVTSPFSFVASANCVIYEDARPVFCDIDRRTLNIAPEAAAAAVTERTTGLLPVHIFGYPADMPGFERLAADRGLWLVEDACEALGAVHADGTTVGARGNPATFGFYPNKQLATGEGGALTSPDAEFKARVDSERNQGRAPDMGWLDHDRLGFNYRLSALACALGLAQLERLETDACRPRPRRGAATARRWPASRAWSCRARTPAATAGAGSCTWSSCRPGSTATTPIRALREQGIDSKPYLPAIHLMSFYRERFGHREGEFPVCEDVAARSLALPFFPELTEAQVQRVAGGPGRGYRPPSSLTIDTPPGSDPVAGRVGHLLEPHGHVQRPRRPVVLPCVQRHRPEAVAGGPSARPRSSMRAGDTRAGGVARPWPGSRCRASVAEGSGAIRPLER